MSATPDDADETEPMAERSPSGPMSSIGRGRDTRGVSRDALFDVLSNHRRRYALHSLKAHEDVVGIGDLAERIAAWENGVSMAELTAAERKRVYTSLQQFHLPKMDAKGIVEYDNRRGTVALTDAAASLDVYLDVVAEDDIPWSRYYLGLSALSLAGVVGVWLTSFSLVPGLVWAALVAVAFMVSALAHAYRDRRMRLGTAGAPPDLPER